MLMILSGCTRLPLFMVGAGDVDLTSKAQILAYYELVMDGLVQAPHNLHDWFIDFRVSLLNKQKIRKVLGLQWLWNRQVFILIWLFFAA